MEIDEVQTKTNTFKHKGSVINSSFIKVLVNIQF